MVARVALVPFVLGLCWVRAAAAHDCGNEAVASFGGPLFDKVDADADAVVTLAEARAAALSAFARLDADRDGAVTRSEADAGLRQARALRAQRRFASLDRDGDGVLTERELGARHVRRLDADADGAVTTAEFLRKAAPGARRGRGTLGAFDAWDHDADGRVMLAELQGEVDRLFRAKDRDRNGALERRERHGAARQRRSAR